MGTYLDRSVSGVGHTQRHRRAAGIQLDLAVGHD
jgi:hypothetical protein